MLDLIRIGIGFLIVAGLSAAHPVMAGNDRPGVGERYRSPNGYVTLSFQEMLPDGRRLVQFVNDTPGEHWVGELLLDPAATEPSHRQGTFWDVVPASDPPVICTGEVDLQPVSGAQLPDRLAVAFKIMGGKHCDAMIGDRYTVDFVAVPASD